MNLQNYQPSISVQLTVSEASELVLAPAIVMSDPMLSELNIFRMISGKGESKIAVLDNVSSIMRAPENCDWKPYHVSNYSNASIKTCAFQIQTELCKEQIEGCLALLDGVGVNQHNPLEGEWGVLVSAYAEYIKLALKRDMGLFVWMGAPDFGTTSYPFASGLNTIEPSEAAKIRATYQRECGGVFYQLLRATANGTTKHVQSVKAGADATKSTDVAAFLRKMIKASTSKFKSLKNEPGDANRPVFLLQPDIYDALYQFYVDTNCCDAKVQYIQNGAPVEGVLRFEGYLVYNMWQWGLFDEMTGAMGSDKSKNQRAILTTRGNAATLVLKSEAAELENGSGMVIQSSNELVHSFKTFIQADFHLGVGILDETQIVYATNIGGVDPNTIL